MTDDLTEDVASPPVDPRTDPELVGDERATLNGFLDWHRETLAYKCDDLSDADLRRQPIASTTLSLLGLVRHMAEVERSWFRRVINGEEIGWVYSDVGDNQAPFQVADADREEAFANWHTEIGHARRIEAAAPDLEVTGLHQRSGSTMSLRWVLVHMIEEYARHNGHADLLREAIDGRTGE